MWLLAIPVFATDEKDFSKLDSKAQTISIATCKKLKK
jgi:hypothetical protein